MNKALSFLVLSLSPLHAMADFDGEWQSRAWLGRQRAAEEAAAADAERARTTPLRAEQVFYAQKRVPMLRQLGLPKNTPTQFRYIYDHSGNGEHQIQVVLNGGQYLCRKEVGDPYLCQDENGTRVMIY